MVPHYRHVFFLQLLITNKFDQSCLQDIQGGPKVPIHRINYIIYYIYSESGVNRSSIRCILKDNKWHPHKMHMLQHLCEDDQI